MQCACFILLRYKYYLCILYEANYWRVKARRMLQRENLNKLLTSMTFDIDTSRWRYYRVPNSILIQDVYSPSRRLPKTIIYSYWC